MSNTEERTYPLADAADRHSPRPDFAVVAYTARMLDSSKGRTVLSWAICDHQSQGTADAYPSCHERSHGRYPAADGLCSGT